MKQSVLALLLLAASGFVSAELSDVQKKKISEMVREKIEIEITPKQLGGEEVAEVLTGKLVEVEIKMIEEGGYSSSKRRVAIVGEEIKDVEDTTTNKDMPILKSLIRDDFRIKTMEDAKKFEAVADALFPISDSFSGKDLKAKKILQDGTKWTLIRGEFFKDLKGFLITTDKDGKITDLKYSLRIPNPDAKKEEK